MLAHEPPTALRPTAAPCLDEGEAPHTSAAAAAVAVSLHDQGGWPEQRQGLLPGAGYTVFVLLTGAVLLMLGGCGFGVLQIAGTIRGGYSDVMVIDAIAPLDHYTRVQFEPLRSDIGHHITPEILHYLNAQIAQTFQEAGWLTPEGCPLQLSGTVIYLQDKMLGDTIVARVALHDLATSHTLGAANIVGSVNGPGGLKAAARGLAGGVNQLLENHGMRGQ